MDKDFHFNVLYPLQDRVLAKLRLVETSFYLTGGTAASRGYLHHRLSDDLDFFVNDDSRFGLWSGRVIQALGSGASVEVTLREERFVRINVIESDVPLKIEMVNGVPAHVGEITIHPLLGRLDTAENILANKLTALVDRNEPKDLADIWGFCSRSGLSIAGALEGAQSKAAGLFPADLARALLSANRDDWATVRWIQAPDEALFLTDLHRLGESLLELPSARH